MAKPQKIEEAMRNHPQGIRYSDAVSLAKHHFGKPRQEGSSHCVWTMPWQGDPRVNLQKGKAGKAKAYQVRQLLAAIDKLRQQR